MGDGEQQAADQKKDIRQVQDQPAQAGKVKMEKIRDGAVFGPVQQVAQCTAQQQGAPGLEKPVLFLSKSGGQQAEKARRRPQKREEKRRLFPLGQKTSAQARVLGPAQSQTAADFMWEKGSGKLPDFLFGGKIQRTEGKNRKKHKRALFSVNMAVFSLYRGPFYLSTGFAGGKSRIFHREFV